MRKIYEHDYKIPILIALVLLVILLVIYVSMGKESGSLPSETTLAPETSAAETTEPAEKVPAMPAVTFKSDLSAYENDMNPQNANAYLLLVNKQTPLGSAYKPNALVSVKDANREITLEKTAERALEAMFIEMRAQGFTDVFVTSAYRSYEYQTMLFDTYIAEEKQKDPSLSHTAAKELVLRYSAAPGTSEHQSGLCVDLMTNGMSELDESFASYPVYAWLCDNAWKFGFILRYPKDKTDITGYDYEPWHYRFVGREHAHAIYSQGFCLEEYLK
jgi:D-alanyl-D-alanine carboxypeptidase